jgi:hypothetical protein
MFRLGLVRPLNPETDLVTIFVSHQWTANAHPDHSGKQLRTLQGVLQQMVAGSLGTVGDGFGVTVSGMGSKEKLSDKGLKEKMRHTVVWLDFASVPQPSVEKNEETRVAVTADSLRAIHSIPACT